MDLIKLEAIRENLHNFENLNQADMSFSELIYTATQFDESINPEDNFKDNFGLSTELLVSQIQNLGEMIDREEVDEIGKQAGICFLLALRSLVWDFGILSPYDYLWSKFYSNTYKYAIYTGIIEDSERLRRNLTESEIQEAKQYTRRLFQLDPEVTILRFLKYGYPFRFPKTMMNSLSAYQLLQKEWLVSLGDSFTPSNLFSKLMDEVGEMDFEVFKYLETGNDKSRILAGFECTDIAIYLLQIINILDLEIVNEIKELDYDKYIEILGLDKRIAIGRKKRRDVRWFAWIQKCKNLWFTKFN